MKNIQGYKRDPAPAVLLEGPSNRVGTAHYLATNVQRLLGGGTFGDETEIAYKALVQAGLDPADAAAKVSAAKQWFEKELGICDSTPTRVPANRRKS